MKKTVFALLIAGSLMACNDTTTAEGAKDSAVDAQKGMVDSSADAQKEMIDSSADAQKAMLDSTAQDTLK